MTDAASDAQIAPLSRSVLVVTGMAGAGRSTVSNALEDLGWYVVDNLPPQMLRPLLDLAGHSDERLARIAVGCTGGKHRSVAVVERMADLLAQQPGVVINVKHRDLGRE